MAPRDYKARTSASKTKRSKSASVPRRGSARNAGNVVRWRWFGVGLCVGAVATAALFLYEPSVVRQVAKASAAARSEKEVPPRTRFEFYTTLTEKEMLIPDSEFDATPPAVAAVKKPKPAAVAAAPATPTQPSSDGVVRGKYLLQVGSFRSHADADGVKAKLAFLGLKGSIQTISINGKETWHRVRVGPYSARAQLEEARATLKANKYDVLLLKLKGQ